MSLAATASWKPERPDDPISEIPAEGKATARGADRNAFRTSTNAPTQQPDSLVSEGSADARNAFQPKAKHLLAAEAASAFIRCVSAHSVMTPYKLPVLLVDLLARSAARAPPPKRTRTRLARGVAQLAERRPRPRPRGRATS